MTSFDFDLRDSDLQIGLEVEYPIAQEGQRMRGRGLPSNDLQSHHRMPSQIPGSSTYDGTVGLEIVSNTMPIHDAPAWYASVINHVEDDYDEPFEPTGLMDGGSTAGLHVHLSSLSRSQARELYEISQEPWAKVLFCSSIATDGDDVSWPVFRGGRYCQMDFGNGHYDCVNERHGNGHYEWRMPEPMQRDHIEVLVRFLTLFEQDVELAREYAQDLLDSGDDRITSIRRAEEVGMDLDGIPDIYRAPADTDPENFYETVSDSWMLPEIYTVEMEGERFYTFDSDLEGGEFNAAGTRFHADSVLHANSLSPVEEPELRDDIRRALQNRGSNGRRETEATEELKKIVKKKNEKA